jgi:hypothetical protein
VLGAYKFTQRFEGVLRADFIYNQKNGGGLLDYTNVDDYTVPVYQNAINGIGPAYNGDATLGDPEKGANRYAITAGFDYYFNANVTFKGEYRYDAATLNVFGNKDLLTGGANPKYLKNNSLLATSVVFFF